MAAFSLHVGKRKGHVLFANRCREIDVDDCLEVDSDLVIRFCAFDPYQDLVYFDETLVTLRKQVEEIVDKSREEAKERTLRNAGKSRFEDWMQPLLDREISKNSLLIFGEKLIQLIQKAQSLDGSIIYWGD